MFILASSCSIELLWKAEVPTADIIPSMGLNWSNYFIPTPSQFPHQASPTIISNVQALENLHRVRSESAQESVFLSIL